MNAHQFRAHVRDLRAQREVEIAGMRSARRRALLRPGAWAKYFTYLFLVAIVGTMTSGLPLWGSVPILFAAAYVSMRILERL